MLAHVLVALTAIAAVPGASFDDSRVVARVNGVAIGAERAERYFEDYLTEKGRNAAAIRSPAVYESLYREAVEKLVEAELLWQEASRRKLVASKADVEAALAQVRAGFKTAEDYRRRLERGGFDEATYAEYLRKQLSVRKLVQKEIVAHVSVSDAEVHAYYEENRDRYARPEQVRARHILVKLAPSAPAEQRAEARKRIEAVLAEARGGASFEDLARERSEDGTAAQGGDLGFFGRGQMVKPFEEAAFALAKGELSGVVETMFGFHVIQVTDRRAGEKVPESEVRAAIRDQLFAQKAQRALQERVDDLRARGRVEIAAAR